MQIKKKRVTINKHKNEFMLLVVSRAGMDSQVPTAHSFYKAMILEEIEAKMDASMASSTSTLEAPAAYQHTYIRISECTCVGIDECTSDGIGITDRTGRGHHARWASVSSTGAVDIVDLLLLIMFNLHGL
jgi:hypothetical protein